MNFVGCNIKYFRKKHNLSQEELAEKVGLRRGNIASYEKNIAEPKINNLVKLAGFFRVQVIDFITKDLKYVESHNGQEPTTLVIDENELNRFIDKTKEYREILTGFKCYHKFKMSQISEKSKDLEMIAASFEKLFEVAECMMKAHQKLIDRLQNHCSCDR